MKTHKNLYPKVWDFENLLIAARKAQRGKRREPDVYAFNAQLEKNALRLQEELRHRFYIRYVDDFVVLADDKALLHDTFRRIESKLAEIGLTVHPRKRSVFPVSEGCDFMGYRIWPDHRRLRPKTGYHSRRKLVRLARRYGKGEVTLDCVRASIAAWIGHVKHADTWGLRKAVLEKIVIVRAAVLSHEAVSR